MAAGRGARARSQPRCPRLRVYRRIYRRDFTDFTREGIFALGSVPLWGNSKFYLRVKSLPGVSEKPPYGLILDSTVTPRPGLGVRARAPRGGGGGWPLQDIRSLQSFLALVNHPCIAPSICFAHTIAILLHD